MDSLSWVRYSLRRSWMRMRGVDSAKNRTACAVSLSTQIVSTESGSPEEKFSRVGSLLVFLASADIILHSAMVLSSRRPCFPELFCRTLCCLRTEWQAWARQVERWLHGADQ